MKFVVFAAFVVFASLASAAEKHCQDIGAARNLESRETPKKIGELCVQASHIRRGSSDQMERGDYTLTLIVKGKKIATVKMKVFFEEGAAGSVYETYARTEKELNSEHAMKKKVVFRVVNDDSELKKGDVRGTVSFLGKDYSVLMKD